MYSMKTILDDVLAEQTDLVEILFLNDILSEGGIDYDGHYLEESYLRSWQSDEWDEWTANPELADEYDSFADYLESYHRVEVKEIRNIDEWWLITDRMQRWLEQRGEPILSTDLGTWWGRTAASGSLEDEDVFKDILAEMKAKFG